MRKGRAIIVSAFVALGLAGSILAGPAVSAVAAHAPAAHVHTTSASSSPKVLYHI
jgi:hypothetical protein